MLTRKYQLLLLAAVVFAAFYPAVLANFSRIDDVSTAEQYRLMQGWHFHDNFIPSARGGLYYRPLIGLSFLIDKHFLGLMPGLMHFENILLHFVNAVLVFFLTSLVISPVERNKSNLPLLASILFALHPINAESVNWISGRTDLLAGTFILMSAVFILKFRELQSKKYFVLSLFALLGGALTKETSLAFLPGAFLMASVSKQADSAPETRLSHPVRRSLNNNTIMVLSGMLVAVIFFMLRSMAYVSNTSRIGITLMAISTDWIHTMFVVLRAYGFYLKKLFFPYPLNFAIMEVDPLYELLAVPLVALCIYIANRRTLVSAVFTAGVFLITPSFLLAFGQIAWTPYAERYIYLTSAFCIIAVIVYINDAVKFKRVIYLKVAVSFVLIIMFVSTLNRSVVWQNDLALCKDTVEKSPQARDIRGVYAGLLAKKGDFIEALRQLDQGRSLPSLEYDEQFDIITAYIFDQQGKINAAIQVSERALQKAKGKSKNALNYLIEMSEEKKIKCNNRSEKDLLEKKILAYTMQLYELNHDPHLLYRLGINAEALGEHDKAIKYFQQACNNMSDTDEYKKFAKGKLEKYYKNADHENTYDHQ